MGSMSCILFLKGLSLSLVSPDILLDLLLMGVVVGKGGMDLSQREMPHPVRNLLRKKPHPVPDGNSMNADTGSGHAGPTATNPRIRLNEGSDVISVVHGESPTYGFDPSWRRSYLRVRERRSGRHAGPTRTT